MDKENVDYIYKELLFSHTHKKREFLLFVTTQMDLEGIMLSETRLTEEDKYVSSHLYVESENYTEKKKKKKGSSRRGAGVNEFD